MCATASSLAREFRFDARYRSRSTAPPPCGHQTFQEYFKMTIRCPRCQSAQVETKDLALKTCSTVGTVAGATAGVTGAMSGAEVGATAGAIAGPVGMAAGSVVGAIIGGLIGAAAGRTVGSHVGRAVDERFFDNYTCLHCGYSFGDQDVPGAPSVSA